MSTTEQLNALSWFSKHDKDTLNKKIDTLSEDDSASTSSKRSIASTFSKHFKNHKFYKPHTLFRNKSLRQVHHRRNSSIHSTSETEDELSDNESVKSRDSGFITGASCQSRRNSIFSLPEDIDSPEIGFQKLKQDGNLVDYDDMSVVREEEQYQDDLSLEVQARSRSVIRNDLIGLAFNGPFQSPLQTDGKKHVLHVGCGNGTWCVEMAKLFPNWLVVGIDDKTGGPTQDQRKVPKNFKYIRCYYDVLRTLKDIPSQSFDFILCRFLIFSYTEKQYKELIVQVERICRPGGFAEFNELDMRIYGNPRAGRMTRKLNARVFSTMESKNLNPRLARKLTDMVSATFYGQHPSDRQKKKNFSANHTSLPLGLWGGRLGVMFRDDINDLFEHYEINPDSNDSDSEGYQRMTADTSCSEEEQAYHKDLETMDEEMDTQKSFMNLHHVYARKRLE